MENESSRSHAAERTMTERCTRIREFLSSNGFFIEMERRLEESGYYQKEMTDRHPPQELIWNDCIRLPFMLDKVGSTSNLYGDFLCGFVASYDEDAKAVVLALISYLQKIYYGRLMDLEDEKGKLLRKDVQDNGIHGSGVFFVK